MLLFLFFLVFLLHDVQLVVPGNRNILYRSRDCSHGLQILLHYLRPYRCLPFGRAADYLRNFQNFPGCYKNQEIKR